MHEHTKTHAIRRERPRDMHRNTHTHGERQTDTEAETGIKEKEVKQQNMRDG